MTESQKIELRRSKVRERLAEIAALQGDQYTDEIRAEEGNLQSEYGTLETRYRSAVIAEDQDLDRRRSEAGDGDAEHRERIELRSKARLTEYLLSAARGRLPSGAEAELQAAAGVGGIPLELWDTPAPERREGAEHRVVSPAPSTVGVNLDPIRPAVFANSIAPRLGIEMPRVASGTFATANDQHVHHGRVEGEVCGRTRNRRGDDRLDRDPETCLGAARIDAGRYRRSRAGKF